MHLKHLAIGLALAMAIPATTATAAKAADGLYIPLFTYRTGPFAGDGIPFADGMHDYYDMLNARDGGIGGEKLVVTECEDGYDTQKGVQCYDSAKDRHPVIITPFSTGITEQLIPRAAVDKIPIFSMAYGLSASADGKEFPWVFNAPDTYWDGAATFIRYAANKDGGFDKLKGKTIGLLYLDVPYGKEPIPLLQSLAKDYGFTLKLYPVPVSSMQSQSATWLSIRRDRPEWIYLQGWGSMNPTAIEDAAKNGFNLEHLIGVWWSGNYSDAQPAGVSGKGYTSLDINNVGTNYPAVQDILKYVVDKGKSQTPKSEVGRNLYDRGVMNAAIVAEAIRNAQKMTGKKDVDGTDVRAGMEALNISAAGWKAMGLPDFAQPIHLTCSDHNGHGKVFVMKWDGTKWVRQPGSLEPIQSKVQPLVDAAAAQYVKAHAGWPKRTEPCAKSS